MTDPVGVTASQAAWEAQRCGESSPSWSQFTKGVPNGRLVEVQSSHDIDLDQPELVIKEINRILEMA